MRNGICPSYPAQKAAQEVGVSSASCINASARYLVSPVPSSLKQPTYVRPEDSARGKAAGVNGAGVVVRCRHTDI